MAYKWCVVLVDQGTGDELEVTKILKLENCIFQPTGQGRPKPSQLEITFHHTQSYLIKEGMEIWAGWRDPVTKQWDPTRQVYGGFVGEQIGGARASRHIIRHNLDEYDVLFGQSGHVYWPNNDYTSIYPPGHSIANWIAGTSPFPGLLQDAFGDGVILLDGIDAVFDAIILDATCIPGSVDGPPGLFGVEYLKDSLDQMVAAAKYQQPGIQPVYYFEPAADGTQIKPRFRMIDRGATTGSLAAVFSTDPQPGEWAIEQPFEHHRDIRPATQRILVLGKGGDPTLPGTPLVLVDYSQPAHLDAYPTKYQRVPGRLRIIKDDRLNTLASAQRLAESVEAVTWAPEGRIRFRTSRYTVPGEVIALNIPQEGQNGTRYVVNEVTAVPNLGRPLYDVVCGADAPDITELGDQAARGALTEAEYNAAAFAQGLGALHLAAQPGRPMYQTAEHSNQNTSQGRYKDVVAHRYQPQTKARPGQDAAAVPGAAQVEHLDQYGNVMDANGHTGVPWARIPFDFPTATTQTWFVDELTTLQRILISDNTVSLSLSLNGSPLASVPALYGKPATRGDEPPLLSSGTPLVLYEGDELALTPTAACRVILTERPGRVIP